MERASGGRRRRARWSGARACRTGPSSGGRSGPAAGSPSSPKLTATIDRFAGGRALVGVEVVRRPAQSSIASRPGARDAAGGARAASGRSTGPTPDRRPRRATLRVVDVRSHAQPRPRGREPAVRAAAAPRHRRSRLVAVPPRHEPTDQATAALGRWVDDLRPRDRHVARPDLLAVVEERRPAHGQARGQPAARAISSLVSASASGASRDAWRDWSWFESTIVGHAASPNRSSCFWLASAKPSASQCVRISSKSKTR